MLKLERCDKISKRIVEDGIVVAIVAECTSGKWALLDCSGNRIMRFTFWTPRAALEAFKQRRLAAGPQGEGR